MVDLGSDLETNRSRKVKKEQKKRNTQTRNDKVGYRDDIGGLYGLDDGDKK